MNFIRDIFNSRTNGSGNFFVELKNILGYAPKNKEVYKIAFTHRSMNKRDNYGNPVMLVT